MKLTTMAEHIKTKVRMAPRVFLRCVWCVTQPLLKRFCNTEKASHSHGSDSCAGRPETGFLDFWSTSIALYAPDENGGLKRRGRCFRVFWALVCCTERTRSGRGPKVQKTSFRPATATAPDFGTCCIKTTSVLKSGRELTNKRPGNQYSGYTLRFSDGPYE